jgi:non-specific serine/threonine protein kinase
MPLLTREIVNPDRFAHYWESFRRGRVYFKEGRVTIVAFSGESATCSVRGHSGTYTVTLEAGKGNRLEYSCTCPHAARGYLCKHVVASAMALWEYIGPLEQHWDYRLMRLVNSLPPKESLTPSTPDPYLLIYGLQLGMGRVSLSPYTALASHWAEAPSEPLDVESFNRYLDSHRSWQEIARPVTMSLDPYNCLNLPPEAVQTCNLLLKQSKSYYYRYDESDEYVHFSKCLLILARQNVPIFLMASNNRIQRRLRWLDRPVTLEVHLMRTPTGLTLDVGANVGEEVFSTQKENFQVISTDPPWVLLGDTLVPVTNPEVLRITPHLTFTVPLTDETTFRDRYFPLLAERLPVSGDVAEVIEVAEKPVPRLYLREEEGTFRATMVFAYGDHELEANPKALPVATVSSPGTWTITHIRRQLSQERHYYQILTQSQYGLKRAGHEFGPAVFQLRARTHPLDFLTRSIPLLAQAGFEVYGQENLKSARLKTATPVLRVSISSGIDWFDIEAIVQYGDQSISLKEVMKVVRKGERYVKLADGTFGQVPEEWVERYKHLFGLAEETEKGLRVRETQLPLLDDLLTHAAEIQAAQDFQERRERLRTFEQITPQPLPARLRGELRPYQKAGVDWLHFLHEYHFGGILADDMGLGKTVQVLCLLQSLKEQGKAERASLLVVPKSLLVNWEREVARFTPELSLMEFTGTGRRKDPSVFDGHDIVLTTYGTMLRDIEFLRTYRFHYAILDESQAIKNPLSKSGRAARLINADHRLVMTGTPVENTTFELWSQVAFVNPGLLGNLDYFKEAFANPIESRQDEAAATTLRKLVYPFILRRTKAQVAPELPPRTERVLFTDLNPAQRKLYNQTRDRYRAELLGLIERESIENARMKILEGLLRLRQVCIHPALVDPTYHSESAKFELLFEVLETLLAENHKALIYSQFVEVLKLVRAGLEERGVRYAYLDGQTRDRHARVDLFQSDPGVPFFLLSLKAGGVGLNLTAAEYVIHLDPWWNPAVEMQAADRAHRIGQEKPVFIYKFIARETVEEKILQLQERKRELVEQLISAEGSFFKALSREDVEVLFS